MRKKHAQDIIIFGIGGNSIDILEIINDINASSRARRLACKGFLDDSRSLWGKQIHGVKVLGPLAAASDFKTARFVNGIGSPSTFWKREHITASSGIPFDRFETLVHPSAVVSKSSQLGHGTVIFQNAAVTSRVVLGFNVLVLPNSILSHDSVVGDHSCVAGGVCISGGVIIGKCCYIGSNASIIQNVKIGDYCLVGIGSTVLRNVSSNSVVVGNPSRFLRKTIGTSLAANLGKTTR